MINADKPHKWKEDTQSSVDQFNEWFMKFAPQAFRESRVKATEEVERSLILTSDLRAIDAQTLATNPQILPTLRMACCPPLARTDWRGWRAPASRWSVVWRKESCRDGWRSP